jgi:uncharacterized protein involved in exopolysaccharide biosynthesis
MSDTSPLLSDRDPSGPPLVPAGELVGILWRSRWFIGGCTLLVTVLALSLYCIQVPSYTSAARILVQTDQLGTPSFLSGIAAYRESQFAEPVNRKIETEMALMLTRSNGAKVIQRLDIRPDQLPETPLAQISRWFGDALEKIAGRSARSADKAPDASQIDTFLSNIGIEPVRSKIAETTSNVLEVTLNSTDRRLAPRALEAMLDAYLEVGAQQSQQLGQATSALLTSQIADSRNELQKIEKAIVALAVRESTRAELTAAATSAAAVQGSARREVASSASEAAISVMVNQLLQLQGQLDELRESFTDATENVRRLRQRVAEARERLAAHMRASALTSAEFSRLERQRALAQDHYLELRRKLEQIDLYMHLTPAALNGRVIVDPPSVPATSEARKSKIIIFAGPVAGLLLGLLLASLRELLGRRLRTRREVERALGIPMLGAIPTLGEGAAVRRGRA